MTMYGKTRADVDLAALLRAQVALEAESDARAAMASLLGFSWEYARAERPELPPPSSRRPMPRRHPKLPEPRSPSPREGRGPVPIEPFTRGWGSPEASTESDELGDIDSLPVTSPGSRQAVPEHVALVPPAWFRGLMTLLLAGPEPSRVLDVRRLERTVLRGVPLVAVPWRVRRSLRRGVELWVDTSESMEPYARDQAELVRGLRGVVGKAAVRVRCFELDPLAPATRQVHWDEGDEPRTMVAGTPVLIVSDFGISRAVARGRPASGQSLAPWTARARERGSRVMGLIPASESAWPATLSTLLTGFEWDRSLSGRALQGRLGARAARRVP